MTSSRTSGQPLIREILRKFADEGAFVNPLSIRLRDSPLLSLGDDMQGHDNIRSANQCIRHGPRHSSSINGTRKGKSRQYIGSYSGLPYSSPPLVCCPCLSFSRASLVQGEPQKSEQKIEQARIGLTTFAQHNS